MPDHLDQHVERARIVDQVAQERGAGQAGRGVARERDHRGVGIGGAADGVEQRLGEGAERLARGQLLGHRLQVLVGGAGILEPERAQVLAGLVLGERRGEEEVRGRDGGQDGTADSNPAGRGAPPGG